LSKIIEIIVSPDGKSRLETKGFVGGACRDVSKFIEQALGHPVQEQLKPEFHTQQSQPQAAREGHSA